MDESIFIQFNFTFACSPYPTALCLRLPGNFEKVLNVYLFAEWCLDVLSCFKYSALSGVDL